MKPCGKPWSQLNNKEKIECLHTAQEQIRKSLNRLYRLVYPELSAKELQKLKKNEPQLQKQL